MIIDEKDIETIKKLIQKAFNQGYEAGRKKLKITTEPLTCKDYIY